MKKHNISKSMEAVEAGLRRKFIVLNAYLKK
jgi:hypothetical protein